MSGNKQDLVERLQTAMLDDNDDLLDQVGQVFCRGISNRIVYICGRSGKH